MFRTLTVVTMQGTTRACFRPASLFLLIACLATGLACGEDAIQSELVRGTERIEPNNNSPWFTISRDEGTIAFMEVDSTSANGSTPFRLVTLDLATSRSTHHHLDEVPKKVFPSDGLNPWYVVQMCFDENAWSNDSLYVCIWTEGPPKPWILFVPGVSASRLADAPKILSCTDCPPQDEWRRVMQSFGLPNNDGGPLPQIAYREGTFADEVYYDKSVDAVAAVERRTRGGTAELLFEKRESFRDTYIDKLRVSPDGRYLAYTVLSRLKSPVPLPTWRSGVYVRDLLSGREYQVAPESLLSGNLMWSANSDALYFAVVDGRVGDGIGDGVFRFRVATAPK